MAYITKDSFGNVTGVFACEQFEGQEFLEGAVLYAPPLSTIEQIRTIEGKPEVADAMARASRQLLLGMWFARVKAKPGAACLSDDQIEAYCRANDATYKTLAVAEDAIKPLRGKV